MDNHQGDSGTDQPIRVLAMAPDAFITIESLFVAMLIRFDAQVPGEFWNRF